MMLANFKRSLQLFYIFRRYRLWSILAEQSGRSWLKLFDWFAPHTALSLGERLRHAFQEAGPLFIKLGQALSTRPDLISFEIAQALSVLQDRVPAFSIEQALACIESEFKKPCNEIFSEFAPIPLGSASIAQVHFARLIQTNEPVVVKILRPNIHTIIAQDLKLLKQTAQLINFQSKFSHLQLNHVVAELESIFAAELDLMQEAANSTVFKRQCRTIPFVHIPRVYWDMTTHKIATFEYIADGIRIDNIDALKSAEINLKQLAHSLLSFFFTQVFEHGYFHADLHPGNILVKPDLVNSSQFALVDFGMMGTLNAVDQRYLAMNLMAFIERDYRQVAALHIECGWVPSNTRPETFEAAIRAVCEPMFERPIESVSFGTLLARLFQTAQSFEMQLQPQLILLQKTILNAEGLARQLDPQLNVWVVIEPIIRAWMKKTLSIKTTLKTIRKQLPYWMARFPELPKQIEKFLEIK